jgi:hypothetical protein
MSDLAQAGAMSSLSSLSSVITYSNLYINNVNETLMAIFDRAVIVGQRPTILKFK